MKRKKIVLEKVLVTGYAAEGRSLAKPEGKAIFIEGAVPGDVVDIIITKNKKDWAEGTAAFFHTYSPERETPFCKHFGICGGCKWQMLPYQKQLEYKQQEAIQNLLRIGKIEIPEIIPIAGSVQTIHYRNKLEFTFSNKKYLEKMDEGADGNKNAFGFHAPRLFDKVIEIEECFLMDPINDLLRNSVRDFAEKNNYTFYDFRNHTGWLRNLVVRFSTLGELMVNVVLGYEDETERKKLLDFILQTVPNVTTLLYTINTKWNDSLHDQSPIVYFGKGFILEKLGDYQFKIGPKSFFQTNTKQAEKLYDITKEFAELTGTEIIYDLYCGTGSIGIFVSGQAQKVIGVEVISEAIEDAKENAALNHIPNVEFFAGDVIDICNTGFFASHGKPDVVIADPPRAGMHEKLVKKLLEIEAPKIVYVSCNSATQARDINLLSEKYEVKKVQPVDLFPHTHHIECVALLKLKNH